MQYADLNVKSQVREMKSQGPIPGSYNEGWAVSPFFPCLARRGKGGRLEDLHHKEKPQRLL